MLEDRPKIEISGLAIEAIFEGAAANNENKNNYDWPDCVLKKLQDNYYRCTILDINIISPWNRINKDIQERIIV